MGLSCGRPVSSQIAVALTTATPVRGNNKAALLTKRTRMVTTPLKKRRVEVAVSFAEHSSLRLTTMTGPHMLAPRIVLRYTQRLDTFPLPSPCRAPFLVTYPATRLQSASHRNTLRVRCVALVLSLPHPPVTEISYQTT